MIEVRNIFNSELIKSYSYFTLRKQIFKLLIPCLIFIVLGFLLILLDSLGFGILMIAVGVLFIPFLLLVIQLSLDGVVKKNRIVSEETLQIIKFDNYYVYTNTSRGNEFADGATYALGSLHSAYQTATHFFLCVAQNQALVIPKCNIVAGTAQEISDLLRQTLGIKYKQDKNTRA